MLSVIVNFEGTAIVRKQIYSMATNSCFLLQS